MKLDIELVPKTLWFSNVRSIISKSDWDMIRKSTYKKANYKCEICGGIGNKWPVECHELWYYDDENRVQTLTGLIALCPDCHRVKHLGRTSVFGNVDTSIDHFCNINNISNLDANRYIESVFEVWRERSKFSWKLNLDWLEYNFNVKIKLD